MSMTKPAPFEFQTNPENTLDRFIGSVLSHMRISKGHSCETLARLTALQSTRIIAIEAGQTSPTVEEFQILADFFQFEPGEMLTMAGQVAG